MVPRMLYNKMVCEVLTPGMVLPSCGQIPSSPVSVNFSATRSYDFELIEAICFDGAPQPSRPSFGRDGSPFWLDPFFPTESDVAQLTAKTPDWCVFSSIDA